MPGSTQEDAILRLVRKRGAIRAQDLQQEGLSRQALVRLYQRGVLDRPSRGLYVLANSEFTENHSLAEAAKLVPNGVVCLLSALRFHDLTTQQPFEVWLHEQHLNGHLLAFGVDEFAVTRRPPSGLEQSQSFS